MLIGPTITLAELEEKLNDRSYEIKMGLPKLQKEFNSLREDFRNVSRMIDVDGEQVTNPDFLNIPKRMNALETEIKEKQTQQELIEKKLVELHDIEERSVGRGNIRKDTYKITMTLSDCVNFGIEI